MQCPCNQCRQNRRERFYSEPIFHCLVVCYQRSGHRIVEHTPLHLLLTASPQLKHADSLCCNTCKHIHIRIWETVFALCIDLAQFSGC